MRVGGVFEENDYLNIKRADWTMADKKKPACSTICQSERGGMQMNADNTKWCITKTLKQAVK